MSIFKKIHFQILAEAKAIYNLLINIDSPAITELLGPLTSSYEACFSRCIYYQLCWIERYLLTDKITVPRWDLIFLKIRGYYQYFKIRKFMHVNRFYNASIFLTQEFDTQLRLLLEKMNVLVKKNCFTDENDIRLSLLCVFTLFITLKMCLKIRITFKALANDVLNLNSTTKQLWKVTDYRPKLLTINQTNYSRFIDSSISYNNI